MTSYPFPFGKPQVDPPREFFECRDHLRDANFGPWLLESAVPALRRYASELKQKSHTKLDVLNEIYYLWAVCLQAEIYDYYSQFEQAREVIQAVGENLESKLARDEPFGFRDLLDPHKPSLPLMRQRLWALVFYSHVWYRPPQDLERTQEILKRVREVLEARLGPATDADPEAPSYGLRARIAYSLGQVNRQYGNVADARREFITAVELTRKRLAQKTKKYEGQDGLSTRRQEQRYANYILAKANSFGLAWAAFNTGELQRARGAAALGATLLETTNDPVHLGYAQVVYAQTLRASARPVADGQPPSPDLKDALELLEPLAREDSPLAGVPRFFSRARYEYVRVLDLLGRFAEAEQRALESYRAENEGSRWHVACGIFLCRLLLKQGRVADARRHVEEIAPALQAAKSTPPLRAEIHICRADVGMAETPPDFRAVDDDISKAEELWARNPLSKAVCHLQRARNCALHQRLKEAKEYLARWDAEAVAVEHGSLLALADQVRSKVDSMGEGFTAAPVELMLRGGFDRIYLRLQRWALQTRYQREPESYLKPGTDPYLGIGDRQILQWQKDTKCYPAGRTRKK